METLPPATQAALDYEKTNWAHGSVFDQEFYQVPPPRLDTAPPPGTPLKIEHDTDTSRYLLPPMTSPLALPLPIRNPPWLPRPRVRGRSMAVRAQDDPQQ